ncbi:MAG: deoxyribonuclease IV [Rubrobacteraceae bacterium]|nr:deoxyribonuclease IV [Rubrobacteraceae bacterium]
MRSSKERTVRVGRHLPTSGGLSKTLQRAREMELETLQIFVSNPQSWAAPAERSDADDFVRGLRRLGIRPAVAHAKYLINLSSRDDALRERSVRALALELAAAGSLGLELVVVHCGSHGGEGNERALERLVEGLERAREESLRLTPSPADLAIENSVGAGTQLCSSLSELALVARRAGVGVCVDTAHAFAAGYDLSDAGAADRLAGEVRGLFDDSLALLHLNDAANERGSHRDGHRRIGEGRVPLEAWRGLLAGLPGIPVVMETPYATSEVDIGQVRLVKRLARELPKRSG